MHLVFDMDDTLVDTDASIYQELITHTAHCPILTDELTTWRELGLTTLQLSPTLLQVNIKNVLPSGTFMLGTIPSPLTACTGALHAFLDKQVELGRIPAICTHRGFHEKGRDYTHQWIETNNLSKYFAEEHIHVINPREHGNKLTYLEKHYSDFRLVDDNPLHDIVTPHPHDPRLLVYPGIGRYAGYVNQRQVLTLQELADALAE